MTGKIINSHLNSDGGSYERLLPQEEEAHPHPQHPQHDRGRWCQIGTVFLYITALSVAFIVGSTVGYQWRGDRENPDHSCAKHTSQYSPVLKSVAITYDVQRFNGTFLKENIFRQDASPEVDAAWESLGVNYRSLRVPADEAEKSGLAPDQVKINEKYGGGYPANLEGLHHLHCLNLLRQTLHWNYDYYRAEGKGAFTNDDYIVRVHATHCLDILRQQLMCTIDTGVLGQVWLYPDSPQAFVDFNTEHKCKNFEAIRRYAEENQLPAKVPSDFLEPPKEGDRIYAEIP
ncbi:hypothetical protein MPDQ_003259 [Monascus purpureus]|uniref:Tat pathway signal sequence n=1 Tax=Monascus purpureus TaxID=5098 RepID=A0A507QJ69_MONPU|nr:hypothetical protein MPDQ_003259 [Monascus purpureus]